jgi:hypothetical protein
MKRKCLYRDYHIVAMSTATEGGRFQSRAAVVALGGSRTNSQRFLDFDVFASETKADDFAVEEAMAWVDAQLRVPQGRTPTNFAAL